MNKLQFTKSIWYMIIGSITLWGLWNVVAYVLSNSLANGLAWVAVFGAIGFALHAIGQLVTAGLLKIIKIKPFYIQRIPKEVVMNQRSRSARRERAKA